MKQALLEPFRPVGGRRIQTLLEWSLSTGMCAGLTRHPEVLTREGKVLPEEVPRLQRGGRNSEGPPRMQKEGFNEERPAEGRLGVWKEGPS